MPQRHMYRRQDKNPGNLIWASSEFDLIGEEKLSIAALGVLNSKGIMRLKHHPMRLIMGSSTGSNGVAERVQRMERVRAMLLDSCLPAALWGEECRHLLCPE
jgi:hypothetical protein